MAHLEYPKHVYKGEGDDRVSKVVNDAEQEALAIEQGYAALPSAPRSEAQAQAAAAGVPFLEFPKHVYRGDGDDRESRIVKNAEDEAIAAEDGFAALSAPGSDASEGDEPDGNQSTKPAGKSKRKK